eukprot:1418904-Rhodomonas_salina.1
MSGSDSVRLCGQCCVLGSWQASTVTALRSPISLSASSTMSQFCSASMYGPKSPGGPSTNTFEPLRQYRFAAGCPHLCQA